MAANVPTPAGPPPPAPPPPGPPGGGAGAVGGGAGADATTPSAPPVVVPPPDPGATLPACQAWRPPPAGPTDPGRWVLGCVQAAAGFQCGPSAAFSPLPQCQIRNWNPACAQQPWLLPQTDVIVNRVPIYGCISDQSIPSGYQCPSTSDVMPSGTTDPTMLVSGSIITNCTIAPPTTVSGPEPSPMPHPVSTPSSDNVNESNDVTGAHTHSDTNNVTSSASRIEILITWVAAWLIILNLMEVPRQ